MKKIFVGIMCLLLVVTLMTGCKKEETNNNNNQNNNANTNDNKDTSTPEGRLSKAGLSLDSIKPDQFAFMENDPGAGSEGVYLFLEKGTKLLDITSDEIPQVRKNFYDGLYDAIAATSTDGKVYNMYYGFGDLEEAVKPSLDPEMNLKSMILIISWSYKKDGKIVSVIAGDTSAESKTDGETYPVFMLDFNY